MRSCHPEVTLSRVLAVAAVGMTLLSSPRPVLAQEHEAMTSHLIAIPEAMRVEHHEIHERLVAATKVPGPLGAAAQQLATALHPHFQREEEIALPPLGLLAPLARGEYHPEMLRVLPMTDSLRTELPRMLEEHEAIHAATLRLQQVADSAGDTEVADLAETLALHARSEEELFYPAALLVGEVVRMRAGLTPVQRHKP